MKWSAKGSWSCALGLLVTISACPLAAQASNQNVVHVHLQSYPDNTGGAAPLSNEDPSNIVVDIPLYPKAEPVHIHDAPSGVGIREATGLHAALGEYLVPTTYTRNFAWVSSVMSQCGYQLTTTNVTAFEYTSKTNNQLHVDITLWDLGDQTLMQYWVNEVVSMPQPSHTGIPTLLLLIILGLVIGETRRRRRTRP